ncbi:serine/threonine-protein kinase [Streptomyces fimicarius]|uniref:serine/threonine-protein kinase n=1 Tax=Streptomyces TaxID=1883 RepID=UPI000CD53F3B|nr:MULTISPECIES: serine/threonine-protein kinase [unclassified Streptomyces]
MFLSLAHDDPQHLGGYRPLARLGSGGMGTVYLARAGSGRVVALKTMHARIASDPVFRTRFQLETEAARVIGPVHGARVFDADPTATTPWLATEYVLGPTLDEAVELAGPLPEGAVRALGARLCAALGQLHRSGVVHRDLKPSNVMLTADGPKVIDFGIARALGDDRLTRTGAAAGTPAYMSPEQATGQEHTSAGDVFALAAVLTLASAGRGPFGSGQAADLLYRVRYAEPDLTGVPAGLFPALSHCLAKDPAERPSVERFAAELAPPAGDFAEQLPAVLLMETVRRAAAVWSVMPHRLPPPADHPADTAHAVTEPAVRSVLSRRRLLALGGGTLFGAAAVAAGVRYRPGQDAPAGKGPEPESSPAWDLRWQAQAGYGIEPGVPSAPHLLKDLVVIATDGNNLQALDAKSGKPQWEDPDMHHFAHTTTDGRRLLAIEYLSEDTDPFVVRTVNLTDGTFGGLVADIPDLQSGHRQNQLLGVADETLYVVGGHGPVSPLAFRKDQSWSLAAFDLDTGRLRWTVPLPARPDGSRRLHFLAARARGDFLVLVQQAADGDLTLSVRDTGTGRLLWDRPLGEKQLADVQPRFAVDDRHVYTTSDGLAAWRIGDGKQAWRFSEGPKDGQSPPTVADDVVYVAEQGRGVLAVGAGDGVLRWAEKGRTDARVLIGVEPAVGPEHVYTASTSGLVATRRSDGGADRPFKAAAGRYFPHERAGLLVALDGAYVAAYPLL